MKRFLFTLTGLTLGAAGLVLAQDQAETPVEYKVPVEYQVNPGSGPWMICTTSFTGPMAAERACKLVTEMRRDYKLPAWVFNRGAEERRKQQEEIDRIHKLAPEGRVRIVRVEEQFAVLIGGYKDMDTARKHLDEIKKKDPPKSVPLDVVQAAFPDPAAKEGKKAYQQHGAYVNPFQSSFVVHNPTVPMPKEDDKPDAFLKQLNADEDYSLLRCRKPWTIAVKQFAGMAILKPKNEDASFIEKLFGGGGGVQLDVGAQNAHNLAKALHEFGFDAYVLHTRSASVVTVGGFNQVDDPRMATVRQAIMQRIKIGGNGSIAIDLIPNLPPMQVPQL